MQGFTLTTYKELLQELIANGYSFQTLQDFIQQAKPLSRQFWELATDPHGLTQTFIRPTWPDKKSHRFAKKRSLGMNCLNWLFVIFD
jgi:hypothetical protein